jgi:hypothetical protein
MSGRAETRWRKHREAVDERMMGVDPVLGICLTCGWLGLAWLDVVRLVSDSANPPPDGQYAVSRHRDRYTTAAGRDARRATEFAIGFTAMFLFSVIINGIIVSQT